jgi:hypothetical protein
VALRYLSTVLGLVGLAFLFVRLELPSRVGVSPPVAVPSAPNQGAAAGGSGGSGGWVGGRGRAGGVGGVGRGGGTSSQDVSLSDKERDLLKRVREIHLKSSLSYSKTVDKGEAFVLTASNFSVDGTEFDRAIPAEELSELQNVLDRAIESGCFQVSLLMSGMKISPDEEMSVRSGTSEWSLWTDKPGSYEGFLTGNADCLPVSITFGGESRRFSVHVKSRLLDADATHKVILDFIGGGLTLQGVLVWLYTGSRSRKRPRASASRFESRSLQSKRRYMRGRRRAGG